MNSSSARGRNERSSSSSGVRYGVCMRSASVIDSRRARGAQRTRDQLLGGVTVDAAQQRVCFQRVVSEREQALERKCARTVETTHDPPLLERGVDPDLLAQLDDDPLGGALADTGHRLE